MPTTITSERHSRCLQAFEIDGGDDEDLAQHQPLPDRAVAMSMRFSHSTGKAALRAATARALSAAHSITIGDMVGSGMPKPGGISLGIWRARMAASPTPSAAPATQGKAASSTTMR